MNIVITGASSGIGEAIAIDLAKDNHNFYLTGRNTERLKKVQKAVINLGSKAYIGTGDVSDPEDVKILYQDGIGKIGTIDVLVANAGVGYFNNLEDISIDEFDLMMNINVRGVYLWLKHVIPDMKKRNEGQILVMSSTAGFNSYIRGSIYCATKHAIQGMVGSLREELKDTRIKIATLNPGAVDTPWFDKKPNASSIDRTKMLSAHDVAKSARLIITQSETSNIEHILLKY